MPLVGQVGGISAESGKPLQASEFKALICQVDRNPDGLCWGELERQCWGNKKLCQIHAGMASTAKQGDAVLVVGVHPAVAVDADAERDVRIDLAVVTEFGNEEVLAVIRAVGGIDAGNGCAVTNNFRFANRPEPRHAEVHAIADQTHARRVGRRCQRVLRQRDTHTAHALGFDAVAVRKVAVCRQCVDGEGCGDQAGRNQCA